MHTAHYYKWERKARNMATVHSHWMEALSGDGIVSKRKILTHRWLLTGVVEETNSYVRDGVEMEVGTEGVVEIVSSKTRILSVVEIPAGQVIRVASISGVRVYRYAYRRHASIDLEHIIIVLISEYYRWRVHYNRVFYDVFVLASDVISKCLVFAGQVAEREILNEVLVKD